MPSLSVSTLAVMCHNFLKLSLLRPIGFLNSASVRHRRTSSMGTRMTSPSDEISLGKVVPMKKAALGGMSRYAVVVMPKSRGATSMQGFPSKAGRKTVATESRSYSRAPPTRPSLDTLIDCAPGSDTLMWSTVSLRDGLNW